MTQPSRPMHFLGNAELLNQRKVAFVCSRAFPEAAVARACRWADGQREQGRCVISGFHSPIERAVLGRLLPGLQPIILALARGVRTPVEQELAAPLAEGRLLICTRYAESVTHACESKCFQRNRLMMELAEEIVVGHAEPGGKLERLCREFQSKKELVYL